MSPEQIAQLIKSRYPSKNHLPHHTEVCKELELTLMDYIFGIEYLGWE
jgi:hypothetical protein